MKRLTKEKIDFLKFINSDEGVRHFSESFFNSLMPREIANLVCHEDGRHVELRRVLMVDHVDEAAVVVGTLKAEGERFKIQMSYSIPHDVNEHALLFAVEDMSPELADFPTPK